MLIAAVGLTYLNVVRGGDGLSRIAAFRIKDAGAELPAVMTEKGAM